MNGNLEQGPKPRKKAVKLVENLRRSGAMIERIPPSEVTRTLVYTELSDMLDAVIQDLYRLRPEAFDTTQQQFFTPGWLKAYLYIQALHHFNVAGMLVSQGAQNYPDATGTECPTPLLAWLSRIGTYTEGDTIGRAMYAAPATTAVIGNQQILSGVPAETSISTSSIVALYGIALNSTYAEAVPAVSTVDATTVLAQWVNNANNYSGLLRSLDYPTALMWRRPPAVPDGSFFAFPTTFTVDSAITAATTPMMASPFIRWDAELAALYYYEGEMGGTTPTPYFYPSIAPRMPVAMVEATITGYAGGSSLPPYYYLKLCFCLILRNNLALDFDFLTVANMRKYHGDPLSSFYVRVNQLDLRGFHEVVARSVLQLLDNGAVFNIAQVAAALVVHEVAMARKVQICSPQYSNKATQYAYSIPSIADSLSVLAPVAQLINEIGPVVLEGQLHCPGMNWTAAWFGTTSSGITSTLGAIGGNGNLWVYGLYNGGTGPTFTLTQKGGPQVTMNSAWITAYTSLGGYWSAPYFSIPYFMRLLTEFTSSGVAYGKGELLFPCSRGPRGGVIMFSRSTYKNASDYVSDLFPNTLSCVSWGCQALASHIPLSGADITLGFLLRPFYIAPGVFNQMKYVKVLNGDGSNPYVDRFVSDIMSPGGVFDTLLAKEMEKQHSHSGSLGIMTAKDNMDQCLWGAIKGIAGTIAQAIQPAASAAAGIGCGMIPGVGQFAKPVCQVAAKNLINYVADSTRVSTNRQEHVPVSVGMAQMSSELDQVQAPPKARSSYDHYEEDWGFRSLEPSEERRVVKPVQQPVKKPQPKKVPPKPVKKAVYKAPLRKRLPPPPPRRRR